MACRGSSFSPGPCNGPFSPGPCLCYGNNTMETRSKELLETFNKNYLELAALAKEIRLLMEYSPDSMDLTLMKDEYYRKLHSLNEEIVKNKIK